MTMDGADSRMSVTKRIALASGRIAAVFGQVGADHDADRRADQHGEEDRSRRCQTMRVQQAPLASRVAASFAVNSLKLSAANPLTNVVSRIQDNQNSPNTVAAVPSDRATAIGDLSPPCECG